jgi:hypothetical protein
MHTGIQQVIYEIARICANTVKLIKESELIESEQQISSSCSPKFMCNMVWRENADDIDSKWWR